MSEYVLAASIDDTPGHDLRRGIARFQTPVLYNSLTQTLTSIGGYLAVCAAMYATADISYWIVLALAPLAAGFLVRTFIIQHDCGHGAFFRSRRSNDALGFVCSLLTLAPYPSWRRQHAGHHGVWNNLDRRNSGADIYSSCLTVDEYGSLSPWSRRWYRLTRSSIIANVILPPLVFLVLYRLPFDMPAGWRRERLAVYLTDLALVALIGALGLVFGFGRVAEIQLPIHGAGLDRRRLALYGAAPLGRYGVGAPGRMERPDGIARRLDVPTPSPDAAMVHRQYRPAPCPSPPTQGYRTTACSNATTSSPIYATSPS